MTWSLLLLPLKAVTSTLLRTILCLRQNALCKTPKRDNWWPDQVFKDYSVVCAISTTSRQWSHLRVFDSFSKQYFSKDTIAGDANAAAYTYFKKQQNQDFYNSSVAVMLRKMQREFNTGRPFDCRLHFDSYTNDHFSQLISASDLDLLFHGYSLTVKTTWTQNHEIILEQLACANARQREKTRWGQLSSQLYWSLGEGDGWKGLSRPRDIWQSHDCTSRLWCPSIRTRLGAPKQRSLATTNRSVLAFSYSSDHSWDALQKLPCKVTREVEGQRGRDRGSQETEDSEKERRGVELHQMEVFILDLDYFILIFCLARMELRRDTRAY